MSVLRTTVTGAVVLPDGSAAPDGARVIFTLKSWDKDDDTVAFHGQIDTLVEDGEISVSLIRTASMDRQINYDVRYEYWSDDAHRLVSGFIGPIAISGEGPYELADLLADGYTPSTQPDALAQAIAAAENAKGYASDSAIAAYMALVGTGTGFDTVSDMLASTVAYGSNTITHNDLEVTLTVASGDIWTAQGFRYQVATAVATDYHLATEGGVLLYLLPDGRGDVSVEQMGADTTGATDASALVQTALEYVATNGGSLVVTGKVLLSSLVEITETSYPFSIDGPGEGAFVVGNSTGGIKITATDIDHQIRVGCNFLAGISAAGCPLEVIFPVPSPLSWRTKTLILDHVECAPLVFNNASYGFATGIKATNAWHGSANKLMFNGGANNDFTCAYALSVDGYSINFDCYACYATNCDDAYIWGGEAEGGRFVLTNAVTVNRSWVFSGTSANPQAVLIGCHSNAQERAVYANNWNGLVVQGCEFYRLSTVDGYKDIEAISCDEMRVTGNFVALGGAVENWFVHLTDCREAIVADNVLKGRWHHVQLEGACAYVSASNNKQEVIVAGSAADELIDNSTSSGNKLLHWKAENWNRVMVNASGVTNTVTTSTNTVVTFGVVNYNDQVGFSSSDPTKLTVPAWATSVDLIASVLFPANSTGSRTVWIRKNGTDTIMRSQGMGNASFGTLVQVVAESISCVEGDYFEVICWQNSGSSLDVGASMTRFGMKPTRSGTAV
ncbi:hypothetical protein [Paenirhodobacter enshiensis]|uniref:hypothetical protein n=1 Tax=Paenirhodobacter enshiensis TaxID=1105367 RepID=UPI0035B09C20